MGWNPTPLDPKAPWKTWEFCIHTQDDSPITGGTEIDLLYRERGGEWMSDGPDDGAVYMFGTWKPELWAETLAEINKRLVKTCGDLSPGSPLSVAYPSDVPGEWAAFKQWLHDNPKWSGDVPVPPVGVYPLYMTRAFAGGYGFDVGIEADGSPACRVGTPTGWKKFILPT